VANPFQLSKHTLRFVDNLLPLLSLNFLNIGLPFENRYLQRNTMIPFTHLHVHSQYSILDGAASIEGLVQKAKSDGMKALALTDHGTMLGIKEFHSTCKKSGIKPILGCETYVASRSIIATNDVHFTNAEDADAHDLLICLNTGKDVDDLNRMRYTKQEWFKTQAEMNELFADIPQALANTAEIVEKVENYELNSAPIMPVFPIPEEFATMKNSSNQNFRKKSYRMNLEKKFSKVWAVMKKYFALNWKQPI
jgi:DNA polymerase III alpha subunit